MTEHFVVQLPAQPQARIAFRQFVEHIGNTSPHFRSMVGVARLSQVLLALDEGGAVIDFGAAGKLLKAAVEDPEAQLPEWYLDMEDADGKKVSVPFPQLQFAPLINAILTASTEAPQAVATFDTAAE